MSMRLDIDNGNGNDMMNGHDQTLTSEISKINEMSTVLPSNDCQQSCFQPDQDTWSLRFPPTGLNASFPERFEC
jgi:hypothetical protein